MIAYVAVGAISVVVGAVIGFMACAFLCSASHAERDEQDAAKL